MKHRSGRTMGWLGVLTIAAVVALLSSGCTDGGPKTYKIGLLSGVDTFDAALDGFKAKMTELGYVEGENVTYDAQYSEGDSEKWNEFAAQFVEDEVDLILTTTTGAAKAARAAGEGTDIPVVFTIVTDPVENGVVDDLRQPGGNLTGITRPPSGYFGKRVEYLKQMAPDVKRLWILYDPDYSASKSSVLPIREAAQAQGIELVESLVKSTKDVAAELAKASAGREPVDAIQMMPDPVNNNSVDAILAFASEQGIPVVAHTLGQTKAGALFSYADSSGDTGKLAAVLADKILKGAKPGELPVETADLFLTVNLKAANAIGLEVPDSVLESADEILR